MVSQIPVLALRRKSIEVTVRFPLPACMVTEKVPSKEPSAVNAVSLFPTRSRNMPRKFKLMFGGGGGGGAVALALAVVPSLKLIVTVKLDPETNKLLASEVKILKLAPSARAKLTVPL